MTLYIRLRDNKVMHPREEYPHKDWPDIIPIPTQEAFGYAVVFPAPQPEGATEWKAVLTSKGHWEQSWES